MFVTRCRQPLEALVLSPHDLVGSVLLAETLSPQYQVPSMATVQLGGVSRPSNVRAFGLIDVSVGTSVGLALVPPLLASIFLVAPT